MHTCSWCRDHKMDRKGRCLRVAEFVIKPLFGALRVVNRTRMHGLIDEARAIHEDVSALVAMTKHLDICPVPFVQDQMARQLFSWEQTMDTYSVPLVSGGIADQPQWFLDACSIIRSVRNRYQNERVNSTKGKAS
jgi:hypothetical protein